MVHCADFREDFREQEESRRAYFPGATDLRTQAPIYKPRSGWKWCPQLSRGRCVDGPRPPPGDGRASISPTRKPPPDQRSHGCSRLESWNSSRSPAGRPPPRNSCNTFISLEPRSWAE
ncbi:unnamed protein product [Rangifer tarandus platyrhynchus]|uniref:Uncharacterized protein n=1 Tax=Rangifer tarandus platyrhynchus TaxID=3082113 RepID=A0AC59ZV87_RANTA